MQTSAHEEEPKETAEEKKKRKRKQERAIAKIKESKEFKRRKREREGEPDDDDEEIAKEMFYQKSVPAPGQLENCEICDKRFTVTPYSKAGPDGGLLCPKCSKELAAEEKKDKKAKQNANSTRRRQTQSKLLDGDVQNGANTLLEACIRVRGAASISVG